MSPARTAGSREDRHVLDAEVNQRDARVLVLDVDIEDVRLSLGDRHGHAAQHATLVECRHIESDREIRGRIARPLKFDPPIRIGRV